MIHKVRRWVVWWSLAAVVLIVAATAGSVVVYHKVTDGTLHGEPEQDIKTSAGSVFSLVVPDRGPSVGDGWSASASDAAVAEQVRSTVVADSLTGRWFGRPPRDELGQRRFTFRALAPGTTTITLTNCVRGCADERDRALSRTVSWNVTVAH
jgi:hypothetical protein